MSTHGDPWQTWHIHDEVTNGSERGVIVRADFGKRLPMVRIAEGPRARKRVFPWETPRWVVLGEAASEAAHWAREDAQRAADLAADTGDNRRTRDGLATLPKWGPTRVIPGVVPNATAGQREAIDRHRGDAWNPFEE